MTQPPQLQNVRRAQRAASNSFATVLGVSAGCLIALALLGWFALAETHLVRLLVLGLVMCGLQGATLAVLCSRLPRR